MHGMSYETVFRKTYTYGHSCQNGDNHEVVFYKYTHYIVVTYLYRKPAESEYGDHDDDHSGHSLLTSPALSRRWLPARVHSFPQSHQHQYVENAYDCQWYCVRREKEEYLKF